MTDKLTEEATRTKVLTMVEEGVEANEIAKTLDIGYPKVLRWRREYSEAKEEGAVASILDVDRTVVAEIVETVKSNKLNVIDAELNDLADQTVERIDGLRLLDEDMQQAGRRLAQRIASAANSADLEARDVLNLADALAKLQIAFFSKGASVNVLNQTNNMSDNSLSTFAGLMKDRT